MITIPPSATPPVATTRTGHAPSTDLSTLVHPETLTWPQRLRRFFYTTPEETLNTMFCTVIEGHYASGDEHPSRRQRSLLRTLSAPGRSTRHLAAFSSQHIDALGNHLQTHPADTVALQLLVATAHFGSDDLAQRAVSQLIDGASYSQGARQELETVLTARPDGLTKDMLDSLLLNPTEAQLRGIGICLLRHPHAWSYLEGDTLTRLLDLIKRIASGELEQGAGFLHRVAFKKPDLLLHLIPDYAAYDEDRGYISTEGSLVGVFNGSYDPSLTYLVERMTTQDPRHRQNALIALVHSYILAYTEEGYHSPHTACYYNTLRTLAQNDAFNGALDALCQRAMDSDDFCNKIFGKTPNTVRTALAHALVGAGSDDEDSTFFTQETGSWVKTDPPEISPGTSLEASA